MGRVSNSLSLLLVAPAERKGRRENVRPVIDVGSHQGLEQCWWFPSLVAAPDGQQTRGQPGTRQDRLPQRDPAKSLLNSRRPRVY